MRFNSNRLETAFVPFQGGLDTETPPILVPHGSLQTAQNVYQGINGGYHTTEGYERFDGQDKPSDALYSTLAVTLTGAVSVGDTLTDATAAASGYVIAVESDTVVMTKIVGVFAVGNIKVGAAVVGTCSAAQVIGGASTSLLNAQYLNLAADVYRSDITAVPGAGNVLGIAYIDGVAYAFRNNAGNTAAVLHKSTTSGWSAVDLGFELYFTSGGVYQIQDGDVITGAISGSTATVGRVVLQSGSWAAGTAAGKLIFPSQSAPFQAENLDVGANLNVATIAGDSAAIALNPSGKYEMVVANFTGSSNTKKIYGCDGKNKGFEFDGTNFVQLDTGITSIFPTHVIEHRHHLFFSFGSSAQHSSLGLPYEWDPVTGADELALGDTIVGFVTQPSDQNGASLAMFTTDSTAILYGTSSADWNLALYSGSIGSIEWSPQFIGHTFMLNNQGLTDLRTSQAYGNFQDATQSKKFQSFLTERNRNVTASMISGDRNIYGIFFFDRSAIFCSVDNGNVIGACPMLFPFRANCIFSSLDTNGKEIILVGDESGYVHQLFKGTSFDGGDIEWYFETSFDFLKTPAVLKNFIQTILEAAGSGYSMFYFTYTVAYGDPNYPQPIAEEKTISLSAETWDTGSWDIGFWDGRNLIPSFFRMAGIGENFSIKLYGQNDYSSQLKFSGALVQYKKLRGIS